MRVHAVITAGGRVEGAFAEHIGTRVKALARVKGRTLLECAIDAAREAGATEVAVIGGDEIRQACGPSIDKLIPEAQSGAQNVHLALTAYPEQDVLYLSSDLPFIDGASLSAFLARVPHAALGMPLADAGAYESRFPNAPEHATTIGAERIANGSVFLIPRGAGPVIDRVAQRLFEVRKNLFAMAVLLGPSLLLKFLFKRLRICDIERKAAALLGFSAFAVRDCAPELCFDIDSMDDYRYAIEKA